jgi:hypothetical protein
MYKDAVVLNPHIWKSVLAFVFGKELSYDKDSIKLKKEEQEENKEEPDNLEEKIKIKKFENLGLWVELNVFFKNFKRIKV